MINLMQTELLIWLALVLALAAIWQKKHYWPVLLLISILLALWHQVVTLLGLTSIALGFLLVVLIKNTSGKKQKVLQFFLPLWAIALAAHQLPGFNNLLVLDQVSSGIASIPYTMYLDFDKPMLIFVFIILIPSMLVSPQQLKTSNNKELMLISTALLLFIPVLGIWLNLINLELSLPSWLPLFIVNNLLLTCVAEEVFFRGYLQNQLARFGVYPSIIMAGVLFGLAHFAGGIAFVFLATLAGIAYGLIYVATGRLSLAILAHFLFNLYHLLFFTYPLAR